MTAHLVAAGVAKLCTAFFFISPTARPASALALFPSCESSGLMLLTTTRSFVITTAFCNETLDAYSISKQPVRAQGSFFSKIHVL